MGRPSLGTRQVVCQQCGKEYAYNRADRKGTSTTKCNTCLVKNRRKTLKIMAVEYKGGACKLCGYNRSVEALDFHHLDPKEKEFGISHAGHTRSWTRIQKELDKTIMVCANCHREIEAGLVEI